MKFHKKFDKILKQMALILLLVTFVAGLLISVNFLIVWGISQFDFFEISVRSSMDYVIWAIAMIFFIFPAFVIGLGVDFILMIILREHYKVVDQWLEPIGIFLFFFVYVYFIDDNFEGISISVRGNIVVSFVYTFLFATNVIDSNIDLLKRKFPKIFSDEDDDFDID